MDECLPPSFYKPLKDLTTNEGECVVLECRVKGIPNPTITWKREACIIENYSDFRLLQKGEIASLIINEAFAEDTGVFECEARNEMGTAITSCKVFVKGNNQNSISTKTAASISKLKTAPQNFSPIQTGKNRVVSSKICETIFSPVSVSIDTDSATFRSINQQTVMTTSCSTGKKTPMSELSSFNMVTYSSASSSSSPSLNKTEKEELEPEKPPFTPQPGRQEGKRLGEYIVYSPGFTGILAREAQEYKVSSFEQRLMNEIQYRLERIPPVSEDPEDEIFEDIPSHQQINPIFVVPLKNYKAIEGASATFTCSISAKPKAKVYWFKDGKQISKRSRHYIQKNDGKGVYNLHIIKLGMEDDGNFTAVACNPQGRVSSSGRLAVYSDKSLTSNSAGITYTNTTPVTRLKEKGHLASDEESAVEKYYRPTFQQIPPLETKIEEGKLVRFDVKVVGLPTPEIEWKINGKPVVQDAFHKIVVRENNVHSLLMERVSPMDEGQYTIKASNKAGSTVTHIQLRVSRREYKSAPAFIERLTGKCVAEGDSVRLEARVVGTPYPKICWKKGSDQITSTDRVHLFEGDSGYVCLQISEANLSDVDWYTCSATNVAGISASNCKLDVYSPVSRTPATRVRIRTPNRYANIAKAAGLSRGVFSPESQLHSFLRESDEL